MRRLMCVATVVAVVASIIVGCAAGPKSFSAFYKGDSTTITELFMMNGGGQAVTTTDAAKIKPFIDLMAGLKFTRDKDQTPKVGWMYSCTLSEGDQEVFEIWGGGDTWNIDGVRYKTDSDINDEMLVIFESAE